MAAMLVAQRRQKLISELAAAGGLKVVDLAARLDVSRATVRRDLVDLEVEGRVRRVRGGAVLATPGPDGRPAGTPTPPAAPVTPSAPMTSAAATSPATSAAAAASLPGTFPTAVRPGPERTLGLLVPSATYYYPRIVAGVQAVLAERGARAIISLSDYGRTDDVQRIDELRASGASGLLVASPGGHDLPDETLEQLDATGLPFVLMERQPQDAFLPCEFVATDHRQGAFAAVRHLVRLGHRRVGLFTNGSPTSALVREGYEAALTRLGLAADVPVHDSGRPTMGSTQADRHYEGFLEDCVSGGVRAALVHSDHDAIELMRRLRSRDMRTPRDLALIAYDDEIAGLADVPLTAVAPPKHELGEHAARLLLDRLDAADPAAVPVRQLLIQPRLVIRSSCGAAART